jgi:hypothetical protein
MKLADSRPLVPLTRVTIGKRITCDLNNALYMLIKKTSFLQWKVPKVAFGKDETSVKPNGTDNLTCITPMKLPDTSYWDG